MTNPYPLPRFARQTAVLVGNGGLTYGPFSGFKCWDVADIEVWAKPSGEAGFALASVVVEKTTDDDFALFTVTFSAAVPSSTEFVVASARVHERDAGVINGSRLDPTALEKELSKQGTVLQELRRDVLPVDYSVPDGSVLMKSGHRLIEGPSATQVGAAQQYATEALGAAAALVGMTNAVYDFTTEAAFEASVVPVVLTYVTTAGYGYAGDNGGHRKRRIAAPAIPEPWQKQSADGAWWEPERKELTPEMFGAPANGVDDDAPAIRLMYRFARVAAVALTCLFSPGKSYVLASTDTADPDLASAVYVLTDRDISTRLYGARIIGKNSITAASYATMLKFQATDTRKDQKFEWHGGTLDLSELDSYAFGIGGLSIVGDWHVDTRDGFGWHGRTAPSGENIGVGGGDQTIFISSPLSFSVQGWRFIGAPDLGIYVSAGGTKAGRVLGCYFEGCQNGIGFKRLSRDWIVGANYFTEGVVGVYTARADGLTNNEGRHGIIQGNIFKKMVRPIDIACYSSDTIIAFNKIEDWAKAPDGSELALSERIGGVRVRAPRCVVYGNIIGWRDWSRSTTSGKEQIGVVLSYDGIAAIGATDCIVTANAISGTLRGVLCDANTSNNQVYGNAYNDVSGSDLDSGSNSLGMRLGNVAGTRISYTGGGDLILLTNNVERLRINQADGKVSIGVASSAAQLFVQASANPILTAKNASAAAVGHMVTIEAARAQNSDFNFLRMISSANGTQDNEFFFRGDGTALADGSWTGGGADYAEYFERAEGIGEDWTGKTVVVEEGFVRPARPGEEPVGAISTTPVVVGDAGELRWAGKYLTDDFGRPIMEPYRVISWLASRPEDQHHYEVNYAVDALPEGLVPPDDAQIVTHDDVTGEPLATARIRWREVAEGPKTQLVSYPVDQVPDGVIPPCDAVVSATDEAGRPLLRRKLNPAFDPEASYVPRAQRPEWVCVGLKGKLRIYKGQPVGSRWVKLKDISQAVEEWLVL